MMQIASRNAMRTKRIEPLRSPIDGHDTSTLDDPTRGGPRTKLSTRWHLHVTVRTSPRPGPAGPSRMRPQGRVGLVHMWRHRTGLRYAFDVYRSLI
ncbi:hypothetical protein BHE74_00058828 [Ensete ventricosum]|nr:hypothetical protein BHE74_00058828 [Ensete ventricosum]